ncbi:MAG: chloride channel protein [Candidatus Delongbacteria bacterium]|nr:chloride channel protein [Candidatus Delongbacteria bacterium]
MKKILAGKYAFLMAVVFAVTIGTGAGFGALLFKKLIFYVQYLAFDLLGGILENTFGSWGFIFVPAIGGLLVGLVIYYGAREAKGHGVPEVMDAMANKGGRIRPKIVVVKTLASALCIGSGGSVGREGPIVQIGSALGSTVGQILKLPTPWIRTLVACGAAAGISATFNTPLAGALFAYELLMPSFAMIGFSSIVISAVIGNVVAIHFLGRDSVFNMSGIAAMSDSRELVIYVLLGLTVALIGFLFVKAINFSEDLFESIKKIPEWLMPVFGGLIVGVLALYSKDLMGVGYGDVPWKAMASLDQAIDGTIPLKILFFMVFLKIIANATTIGSGGSGGVFAPSLFIGGMVGGIFGYIAQFFFPDVHIGTYAIVGGGAFFAAVGRAPITSILMILELTRNYSLVVPVMITVVLANEMFRFINKETIYTEKLIRRGTDILGMGTARLATGVKVEDIMLEIESTILPSTPIEDLPGIFKSTDHMGLLVVNEKDELVGIVTHTDYDRYKASGENLSIVDEICTKKLKKAYPDQTVNEIMNWGINSDIARIPVVSIEDDTKLIGIIRRESFLRAWKMAYTKGERSIL